MGKAILLPLESWLYQKLLLTFPKSIENLPRGPGGMMCPEFCGVAQSF